MKGWSGRKRFLVFFPVLALCMAGAVLSFGESGRRLLAGAAAYAVWAIRVACLAVGQLVPWALLIVVFALTAFTALVRTGAPRQKARRPFFPSVRSRTALWDSWIAFGCRSGFLRHTLEIELRRLATDVFIHTEGVEAADVVRSLTRAGVDVPEAVRRLYATGDDRNAGPPGFFARRMKDTAAYGRWLAEVVGFLEERMGNSGGNAH